MIQPTKAQPHRGGAPGARPHFDASAAATAVLADVSQISEPAAVRACRILGRLEGQAFRSTGGPVSRTAVDQVIAVAQLELRHRIGRMLTETEAGAFASAMRRSALA